MGGVLDLPEILRQRAPRKQVTSEYCKKKTPLTLAGRLKAGAGGSRPVLIT